MKKILLLELCLLFLATNFQSDNPPGWYQQTLPVNDFVNDIFFIDSLNGWIVTDGHTNNNDTGYIMRTSNGGDNWMVQFSQNLRLTTVYFTDLNTGYAGGGSGSGTVYMFKTTNGGDTWSQIIGTTGGTQVDDMFFINSDTGWYCDNNSLDGGLYKTTNGGLNWTQQLGASVQPLRMSFINADTGWMGNNEPSGKLYRTTNGGINWVLQYTSNFKVESLFFLNSQKGWIRGGIGNGIAYSTDGGFTWTSSFGNIATGFDTKFINDSIGYSGTYTPFPTKIMKSTDGGVTWGYQETPLLSRNAVSTLANDTLNVWAGGIMHTTDGGGPIIFTSIQQISTEIPSDFKLYQNYPNPFNPSTTIEFELKKTSDVSLQIFNISGRLIDGAAYADKIPGRYRYDHNADGLTSGIYFYRLLVNGITIDTKKMMYVK